MKYLWCMILADNTFAEFKSLKKCYKYCCSFNHNFKRYATTTVKRIDRNYFEIVNFIDFKKMYGDTAENFSVTFKVYKRNTNKCDNYEIDCYNM